MLKVMKNYTGNKNYFVLKLKEFKKTFRFCLLKYPENVSLYSSDRF